MAFLIFVGVCLLFFFIIHHFFKLPKINALALFTGGVKSGKTTCAVYFALRNYRARRIKVFIVNGFRSIFHKKLYDKPLLYSNIPLKVPYVPLTTDLLLRNSRFVYGSVIYISEASLVADSQCLSDKERSKQINLFNKLIGHETCGGVLIYDTQCVADLHYGIKRAISEYFYIHHMVKKFLFLPLPFLLAYVKECRYSDDGTVIQSESVDTEDVLKLCIIPRWVWRKFDCYCYSALTDNLKVENNIIKTKDLLCRDIISFNDYGNVNGGSYKKNICEVKKIEKT